MKKPLAKTKGAPTKTTNNSIADRLGNLAQPEVKAAKVSKYQSSFFFKLSGDESESARRRALTEKPEVPRSERELDKRADLYKKELPASMEGRIDQVREYMLKEVNPLVLAALAGTQQAFNVLGKATESEVEAELQRRVETMLQKGVNIKLSRFVARYLGLRPKDAETLLERTPPATVVFPPIRDIQPEHPIGNRRERQRDRK